LINYSTQQKRAVILIAGTFSGVNFDRNFKMHE